MEAGTTTTNLTARLPILNPADYDNKVLKRTVGTVEQKYEPTTVEEKQDRRNKMKVERIFKKKAKNKQSQVRDGKDQVKSMPNTNDNIILPGVTNILPVVMTMSTSSNHYGTTSTNDNIILPGVTNILPVVMTMSTSSNHYGTTSTNDNIFLLGVTNMLPVVMTMSTSSNHYGTTSTNDNIILPGETNMLPVVNKARGNFIPRKPDLTFIDEIVKSENMDVTIVITPSNDKTVENKGVSNTVESNAVRMNNSSAPIIED
ncbi:hypothetical protein Tco_1428689 [Tanacetum coccineum]